MEIVFFERNNFRKRQNYSSFYGNKLQRNIYGKGGLRSWNSHLCGKNGVYPWCTHNTTVALTSTFQIKYLFTNATTIPPNSMSVQDTKERNGKKHVWQNKQCKNGVFSEMMKNRRRDYNKNNEHFQTRKFDMWNENKLFLYLQKPIVKEYLWKGGHKVVELTNMCWKMVSTHGVHTMVVYADQYIPSHVPAYKCNCNTS